MDSSRFDELTKALATATSRRQALKRIAGMLGGTALSGLFPGLALADTSACAHFCASVFGADTPGADQCTSDAAHHKGLCYSCGPASPGGTKPICCPENPDGTCTSYSSATCCSNGQVCQNGQCVAPTTTTTSTTTSTTSTTTTPACVPLCNGSCATPCTGLACACGSDNCFFDQTLPYKFCSSGTTGAACASDCNCPQGQFCSGGVCDHLCSGS